MEKERKDMNARKLFYLGPQGTFTHQAAVNAAELLQSSVPEGFDLIACDGVPQIMQAAQNGEGWGVIAWENNVEGYVVPNLDALIDARDLVGFARIGVNVEFDAYTMPDAELEDAHVAAAHPHGLAQCRRFITEHRLDPAPASSNAAACRDLKPGEIALGPRICGDLYDIERVGSAVQDYQGARTEFLVLARREEVAALLERPKSQADVDYESVLTLIPLVTGPGVLADLLDVFRDAGLNMTSFISRPIKGHDGTYSFIATFDAAPWEQRFHDALVEIAEHGDWAKTLAVYPRRERPSPPVTSWMLPQGGVRLDDRHLPEDWQNDGTVRRELMW
jgi:chorismate mutase / prephenate dehydratase